MGDRGVIEMRFEMNICKKDRKGYGRPRWLRERSKHEEQRKRSRHEGYGKVISKRG